jgi:NAD(P)-dependent dehydrogenase (short-subunit alcohol dehydrogenase family)
MGTICVTGSASGMGAATASRLSAGGHRVIGVDLRDADILADLGTPEGRADAIAAVTDAAGGALDGLVTFAGVGPLPGRPGSLVASVNYFGSVEVLSGLRPALARGESAAAVAVSSNSTTCQPGIPDDLVEACLDGDEARARKLADEYESILTYPASKMAISRFVRRNAPTADWVGAGIRLNAIAPGLIDTPLVAEGMAHPELAPLLEQFPIPVARPGKPEELAGLVAYLLSPDAAFFCGSVVFCDGGTDALLRTDDWPSTWVLPEE